MKKPVYNIVLWVAAIAATAYLAKGQDFTIMLIIILAALGTVDAYLIKE